MDTIKRVQDLMQVRDMNLCVLAKKWGISYSTIQTTARRGGQLSVETIERICQGLGKTSSIPPTCKYRGSKKAVRHAGKSAW